MFNIGTGEIALIAVVALLILGPQRLPELARGIGKFMREFRRQTDDVRAVVEREFYKLDEDIAAPEVPAVMAANSVPRIVADELPPADDTRSQVLGGAPESEPVAAAPVPEPSTKLPPGSGSGQ